MKRANSRNLIVGALHGSRSDAAKQLRLDPDREKLRIEPAGLRANRVKVAVAELLLNINVFVQQSLRRIDVHVDCDGLLVDGKVSGRRFRRSGVLVLVVHVCLRTAGNNY
jgi:hypothetical protein